VQRPTDLFDRTAEWDDLTDFATRPGSGIELALVRGRRRQGKSFLLRRLARVADGFYYQAVEEERAQSLVGLGKALGAFLKVPGGHIGLGNWDTAIAALGDLPAIRRPALVVIDEFPYLLRHSPELPSLLQRAIDHSRDGGGPPLRLILCGSALSVMAGLLSGTQALRGRATLDLPVRTFDHRTAAQFWDIGDPAAAFLVHSVLGGTPGYRDLISADPPKRAGDLGRWLAAGPLNPASALFREDDYLLTEEQTFTDRALYHSVVTAVADGNTSQASIAAALGREQRAVQHPLTALVDAGFLSRADDALRSRRPIYQLTDPIVRFHHVVTRRDLARFEDRRTAEAWTDAQPRFTTHVLGPHFEDIARDFAFRFASDTTIGGRLSTVGPAVINDSRQRSQHQLDVVAIGRNPNGSEQVLALGEAKHTNSKRNESDLARLDRIRALVSVKHPSAEAARLLLFSASGFDRALSAQARSRDDVELIDLERIYRGD